MIEIKELFKYVKDGLFTVEKHPDADLYIFGYHSGPYSKSITQWNKTTKQMRGLIVDSNGKIHSRSFEKFFTFREYLSKDTVLMSEGQIAKIPDLPFKIFEKVDGTLTILYWINDIPYLSTQRSFTSLKAQKATKILHQKYSHLFDKLKRDRTYIFEAIYPEAEVLVDYKSEEKLILLGVLNNETGEVLPFEKIGFEIVKDWTEDLSLVKNLKEIENLNFSNLEGFVIVYENGFRIKIKFPWYKEAHMLMNKLIILEYNIDVIESKLKELLSIESNVPDSNKIWERFSKGELPCDIIKDFPHAYKFIGIDEWINTQYKKFVIKKGNNGTSDIIYPEKNEVLQRDFLLYQSFSENIMNNRMINLKNKYD